LIPLYNDSISSASASDATNSPSIRIAIFDLSDEILLFVDFFKTFSPLLADFFRIVYVLFIDLLRGIDCFSPIDFFKLRESFTLEASLSN